LVPASPWLEQDAPNAPSLRLATEKQTIEIQPGAGKAVSLYAVWKRFDKGWYFFVQPASQAWLDIGSDPVLGRVSAVTVSAIDHVGNESPRVTMNLF
jgi:hypothetical protein